MINRISRRSFLQSSALVAACAGTGVGTALVNSKPALGQSVPTSNKPSPIRLGLASDTFRNFTRAQLITFMTQLGINQLNCKDARDHLPKDRVAEVQAVTDYASANITLHAAGTIAFTKDTDQDVRAIFDYARNAGINIMVIDPIPSVLPRIEKFVAEYDIRVALHNDGPEDEFFPSPFDVLKAIKDMDPRIGCCIDLGNTALTKSNVVDAIHAAGSRLFNLHAKDLTSFSNQDSEVPIGRGIMPFREVFEALIAIDYPGFVDLEYEIDPDAPLQAVIEGFAYLRGVLNGMGYLINTAS
jgi:sugar phosphate isomerase/epimerase